MEFGTDFSYSGNPVRYWSLPTTNMKANISEAKHSGHNWAIGKQSVPDTRLVLHGNWEYCYLGAITISEFTPNIPDLRIACSWEVFREACGSFISGTWSLSLPRWRAGRPRLERVSRHRARVHLGQGARRKSSEEKLRVLCKGGDLEALSPSDSHWRKTSTYLFQAIVNRIFLQTLETLSFLTWNICRYSANCSGLTLI